MGITFSQFFPPPPTLNEKTLPSQAGKVFIVTGGASGVGQELVRILYNAGGRVYIAGRSASNAQKVIDNIKSSSHPESGQIDFLHLELDDLSTIKEATVTFMAKESRLDVLWNNAAVSLPPLGSKSKQGHELQLATNCLGHFLMTELLLPLVKSTAKQSSTGSVRVIWSSSIVVDVAAPKGGFDADQLSAVGPNAGGQEYYTISKVGNWFLASELGRRVSKDGIISVTQNPGNLKTNLTRNVPWTAFFFSPLLYHAKFGAYTELWAGLSPDVHPESSGSYVIPWGRLHPAPREDLQLALKSKEEGGTGQAIAFWEWCHAQIEDFHSST
jgi:NAD(P)-dependent dehydrogenase (short-subunit alcohol dehydrogenase family)